MNFEHLIQINDPLNPFVDSMTREQLWEGLVLRAEQPQLFVIGLDSCTILSREGNVLERELHYGQATVRDRVTLARERQRARLAPWGLGCNAEMTSSVLRACCKLDEASEAELASLVGDKRVTARGIDRLIKTARTIADLEGNDHIDPGALREASSFRPELAA